MLAELMPLIPEGGRVSLTITKGDEDGQAAVVVFPRGKDGAMLKGLMPLVLTGPLAEVEEALPGQIAGYAASSEGLRSNLAEAQRIMDEAGAAKKAKAKGGKADRIKGKVEKADAMRLSAPFDHQLPEDNDAAEAEAEWDKLLEEANAPTLEAALAAAMSYDLVDRLGKEVKKVRGDLPTEIMVTRLTELYKKPGQGSEAKTATGKALVKLAGKSLEELELVPAQPSLIGG